jgi:hypothetical protein
MVCLTRCATLLDGILRLHLALFDLDSSFISSLPSPGPAPLLARALSVAREDAPVSRQTITQNLFGTHRAAIRALPPSLGLRVGDRMIEPTPVFMRQ